MTAAIKGSHMYMYMNLSPLDKKAAAFAASLASQWQPHTSYSKSSVAWKSLLGPVIHPIMRQFQLEIHRNKGVYILVGKLVH
jgi:hypothetical protein